jgi:hypothetical protein
MLCLWPFAAFRLDLKHTWWWLDGACYCFLICCWCMMVMSRCSFSSSVVSYLLISYQVWTLSYICDICLFELQSGLLECCNKWNLHECTLYYCIWLFVIYLSLYQFMNHSVKWLVVLCYTYINFFQFKPKNRTKKPKPKSSISDFFLKPIGACFLETKVWGNRKNQTEASV